VETGYSTQAADQIDFFYGAGTWDYSGLFAGTSGSSEVDVTVKVFAVEYTRNKWIAAAEYKLSENEGITSLPALGVNRSPVESEEQSWYAQVTYQATDKLGVGVYYAQSDFDPDNKDPIDDKYTTVDDLALGASYALTDNWLIKVEGHAMDGLAKLNIVGDRNLGATDPKWSYFVVKTTFSF
jgi:predicted porin